MGEANILMFVIILLRDLCKDGVIELEFCKSEDQAADILTKPLKQPVFVKLRGILGVCSLQNVVQGRVLTHEDEI